MNKYLKEIGQINIELIGVVKIGKISLNSAIFGKKIPENLIKYKDLFLKGLNSKEIKLKSISKTLNKDTKIKKNQKKIIEKEIFVRLKKIEFLKLTYDIEANKIDSNYIINEKFENYDHYNKIFFGINSNTLKNKINISENKEVDVYISKKELIELLKLSKKIIPELDWKFGDFPGLSHVYGTIKIFDAKKYNIKRIIAIFFHEMTHFIRYINGKNNLGYNFVFSDYDTLEEGITGFNEYYYGNQIIDYGKYNAYYDKCYQIILNNNDKKIILKEFYNVLKHKGFKEKEMKNFYRRFHKFSKYGNKNLYLKDLIYNNAYKNVISLIDKDINNYQKIMAGKIGLFELENNLLNSSKNFDSKKYFNTMIKEIKKIIYK